MGGYPPLGVGDMADSVGMPAGSYMSAGYGAGVYGYSLGCLYPIVNYKLTCYWNYCILFSTFCVDVNVKVPMLVQCREAGLVLTGECLCQ